MGKNELGYHMIAIGVLVVGGTLALSDGSEEPALRDWTQYPMPHGVPKTPRPPDSEFLKILPPLRPVPAFDAACLGAGMAPWWRDCSVHIFSEQPPTPEELGRQPVVRTTPGEDEPITLGLWGIRDVGPVTVRVTQSPFPITVRRVEFNPRRVPGENFGDKVEGGRVVGFANYLPLDDTGKVVKDHNTVFWLTVGTPRDAKPGIYRADVQIGTAARPNLIEKSIAIEVLDYVLPPSDIAFGMYFRPVDDSLLPAAFRTPEMLRTFWRDMARHGMTSATIYNGPQNPLLDEQWKPTVEGNADVEMLQGMMKEGLVHREVPVMWIGQMADQFARATGEKRESALRALPAVLAEIRRLGLPELLLYGPDEPVPGQEGVKKHLENLQPLRKHFRIVTALSDHPAEVYGGYLDVWAVSSGRIRPALLELARERGAEMWTYDCNNKGTGNAPNSRFCSGLYTWALNLKGNFIWCYTERYAWEQRHDAYLCHVLPTKDGPVPSIQWETRREGVEDYRTLRLLEALIAKDPTAVKAKEAQAWLNGIRYRVDWFRGRGVPPAMVNWDSIELWPACGNFEPAELSAVRAQASAYILELEKRLAPERDS